MSRQGRTPADSLCHRLSERWKISSCLMMLALLASVLTPLTAQAENALNPLCAACHNPDGNSTSPRNPKLAGLDAAYITKQIVDFKSLKRADEVMGSMAGRITEPEIASLATHYSKQKRTPGIVTNPALAAQGQLIYDEGIDSSAVPACAGCHEKDGSGSKKFPRLAGQHTAYLIIQMKNFRVGLRNNDGRMRAVAKRMTDQEIAAAAEYITGLKGE